MNAELSTAKRLLAWGGIVVGVLFATAAIATIVLSGRLLMPLGVIVYSAVLVTDCVFRIRGKDALRNTPRWRRILFGANLLLVVYTFNNFWHSPLAATFLPVFAAMMVLTMGMLYLALLLAGALSNNPAKRSPPVNSTD